MKSSPKIEYEAYYAFCPHCEAVNYDLTDDYLSERSNVILCLDCHKEFKIDE